jgi:hypothetical protein
MNNSDFDKLQKKWYAQLKREGFNDIEGGVEGHLMQGSNPTRGLKAIMPLLNRPVYGESEAWLDAETKGSFDKGKTPYYDAANTVATLAFRTDLPALLKFAWAMHADGIGEPVIVHELGCTRWRVRKYLEGLRKRMQIILDRPSEMG